MLLARMMTLFLPIASSSSRSQQMVVQSNASLFENTHECYRQINSSLDSALHADDDDETLKAVSDDRHLCWHSGPRRAERRQ